MQLRSKTSLLMVGVAGVAALAGCSGGNGGPLLGVQTFQGAAQSVGSGQARSFVKLNAAGNPVELGVTLSESALAGLPADVDDTKYAVSLPSQAGVTPFDHISLDWESHGHEPEAIFGLAHFDVHFYTINQTEQDAIAFAPDEPAPAAQYIPTGYQSGHTVVPRMGQHWIDPTDPNTTPGNFKHTLIYGFHQGKMVFLEPMITRDFLLSKTDFEGDIKQPAAFATPGFYPTHYRIEFDQHSNTYTIVLDEFVQRG